MMAAINGRRASQLLTNREGMVSSGQDFNADRRISEATSLVDTFSKSDRIKRLNVKLALDGLYLSHKVLSQIIDKSWSI